MIERLGGGTDAFLPRLQHFLSSSEFIDASPTLHELVMKRPTHAGARPGFLECSVYLWNMLLWRTGTANASSGVA